MGSSSSSSGSVSTSSGSSGFKSSTSFGGNSYGYVYSKLH